MSKSHYKKVSVQQLCQKLNEFMVHDADAMRRLFSIYVPCNKALKRHPSLVTGLPFKPCSVIGLLGILNGMFYEEYTGENGIMKEGSTPGNTINFSKFVLDDPKFYSIPKRVSATMAVNFLNDLLKLDRNAIEALFQVHVSCNNSLRLNTSAITRFGGTKLYKEPSISPLGLLNGIFGIDNEDASAICVLGGNWNGEMVFERYLFKTPRDEIVI